MATDKPLPPRSALSALLILALSCTTACTPREASPTEDAVEVWRFAIEESEGSVQHAYALEFKERIEERTAGAVKVIVYPYGTLGTSTHMIEQLKMGVIELAMASPGPLGKFIPEVQVFLLHFVLTEDDRLNQEILSDPQLLAEFDRLYAEKGLKLLSIYSEGEMVWTTNKPIRSPDDFQGVKMRVMTSPILLAAYNAYGASSTPMPYSEVFSALQLKMIDGQVNPVFAIERQKFHEVTSWMIFPGHASFITTCAANREFVQGLSPERRKLVEQTIDELDEYIFQVQTRFQTERLKRILQDKKRKRDELHIIGDLSRLRKNLTAQERRELIEENPYLTIEPPLTNEQRRRFRETSRQVRDVFLRIGGPHGEEVLEQLLAEVREARARQREGDSPRPN